ncbi:MAG: hypothetical protein AAF108_08590 [Planctomycetota bacterium]
MRKTVVALLALAAGSANADFLVTEIYIGLTGENGTQDWFEITNVGGDGELDTGILSYDDGSNPSIVNAGQLDSFILADGESAVFLIADTINDVDDNQNFNDAVLEFEAVWGRTGKVGITNGGGTLNPSNDAINLSDDDGAIFFYSLSYTSGFFNSGATIDNVNGLTPSVLGVNGAFESAPFFNDNIGDANNSFTLIGSPGQIPAPASAALFGLAGLAAGRRR